MKNETWKAFCKLADGTEVEFHVNRHMNGLILWCSHWERWPEMKKAGIIKAVGGGKNTYGAVSLYLI